MAKIQVEINGQLHDVKRVQLFDLAKRGVITPDTRIIYNDRELAADMVKGLEFGGDNDALDIAEDSHARVRITVPLAEVKTKEHSKITPLSRKSTKSKQPILLVSVIIIAVLVFISVVVFLESQNAEQTKDMKSFGETVQQQNETLIQGAVELETVQKERADQTYVNNTVSELDSQFMILMDTLDSLRSDPITFQLKLDLFAIDLEKRLNVAKIEMNDFAVFEKKIEEFEINTLLKYYSSYNPVTQGARVHKQTQSALQALPPPKSYEDFVKPLNDSIPSPNLND